MRATVSVSRLIAASAEQLYALVSDLPRMGEWSPENEGGTWRTPAMGAVVGARFTGKNRSGTKAWNTSCRLTEASPGKVFAFDVTAGPFRIANWRYEFEPVGGGTKITETWTDQRNGLARFLGKFASGVADRREHNRAGMETTLARLATTIGE